MLKESSKIITFIFKVTLVNGVSASIYSAYQLIGKQRIAHSLELNNFSAEKIKSSLYKRESML